MTSGKRSGLALLLLGFFSLFFTLALVELGLKLFYPISFRNPNSPFPELQLFHQASSIPGLVYEMSPNRQIMRNGVLLKTNQYGMRDDEPVSQKSDSPCRVAALGDSYTFGWRVTQEEAYPKVLERLLRESPLASACHFEVLNFGVMGYSSFEEALLLKYRAVNFDARVVILGYVLNDPETDPIQPLHARFTKPHWWQYFNVLRLVARAESRWEVYRLGGGDYTKYLHAPGQRKWQSVIEAFSDIREVTSRRNVKVIIVIFPEVLGKFKGRPWTEYPYRDIHKQVSDLALKNGFRVVDLLDAFSQYPNSEVVFGYGDDHPRRLGHQVAAQEIEKELLAESSYFFELRPHQPAKTAR